MIWINPQTHTLLKSVVFSFFPPLHVYMHTHTTQQPFAFLTIAMRVSLNFGRNVFVRCVYGCVCL